MIFLRQVVVSDIHGCLNELDMLLKETAYHSRQDQLILLGDYVDRGLKSRQVIDRVIELKSQGAIALLGNHDQMMLDAFSHVDEGYDAHWLNNGGFQTIESYVGFDFFEHGFDWDEYIEAKSFIKSNYQHHLDFLASLKLYHETDKHIFVHAGINPFYEDWRKQPKDDFIWIRDIFYRNRTGLKKTVIFGHTPAISLHGSADVWFDPIGDKIGVDGASAYGHQLNALLINEVYEERMYSTYAVKRGTGR